ncbi:MAG: HAMP domain-containing sensor histidine kinase [Dinoroseobacter sp.]|nr:HAMP domain-containing sensor histidine kinase [Dinoroseobacter sp.]
MGFVQSTRTRLVAASALLSLIAIALVLGLVYLTANRIIEAETRGVVTAELNGLSDSYADLGMLGLARAIERRISNTAEPDALYLLTDRFGQPIAGNLGAWPPTVTPGSGWVEIELIRTDIDRRVPISAASIQLRGGERLLVGRDASARYQFDRVLGQSLALALATAIGLSLITGWLLTRLVFRRVGEISETAREIVSGDLTQRMPIREGGDEFDQLALTLNDMLDRIEALVANLRMTTNSLSHDLRSPLTRLQGHVEQLTQGELSPREREKAGENALREVNHILDVFRDLTEIARADAGIGRSEFQKVDLAKLAREVTEFYKPVASQNEVSISCIGADVVIDGHKALLNQAVANLLDNAMRYAPPNSAIKVAAKQVGVNAVLSVTDAGPGIPLDEYDHILQPFVTLDDSRSDRHSGLGLALVASVARLHNGKVTLADNAPGLVVSLELAGHHD